MSRAQSIVITIAAVVVAACAIAGLLLYKQYQDRAERAEWRDCAAETLGHNNVERVLANPVFTGMTRLEERCGSRP